MWTRPVLLLRRLSRLRRLTAMWTATATSAAAAGNSRRGTQAEHLGTCRRTCILHKSSTFAGKPDNFLSFTVDVINLTNLVNASWGIQYFSRPIRSTLPPAQVWCPPSYPPQQNAEHGPVYRFSDPGQPYAVDYFGSRCQVQLGLRYTYNIPKQRIMKKHISYIILYAACSPLRS